MKEKENVFDFEASMKKARIAKIDEFENVQVVGSGVYDFVHRVQSCGMVFGGSRHDTRPDDNVQAGHEHRVHLQDMVLDG